MRSRSDRITAVAMIAPSLILLFIFVYGFIARTVYVSLTDWGQGAALALRPEIRFVGLHNYRELFTGLLDVRFRQDLVNMVTFTALFVAGCLAVGLLLATLIDQGIRGEGFFRTVFLFPMSLSFIVTGTVWRWLLQPRGGVNVLPTLVGLPRFEFLWTTSREHLFGFNWQDLPAIALAGAGLAALALAARALRRGRRRAAGVWALVAAVPGALLASGLPARVKLLPFPEVHGFNLALIGIVVAAVWQMSGYAMALFLAGLRGIPEELREAARVDGCSRLQVYRYVELPLLRPIVVSAVVILGHIAMKSFDLIVAMAGTDNAATSVPAIHMYLTTFRGNQFAKGAAIAVMLLVLVCLVIVPYLTASLRRLREPQS